MKIVIDCEFTRLNSSSKLISMALVAEDGRELYFELSDNYRLSECSEFVVERVLPQLSSDQASMHTEVARNKLLGFLANVDSVEIMSDAPALDWEFFCSMACHQGKWPNNVFNSPLNLIDLYNEEDAQLHSAPELPHHALLDARMLMDYCVRYIRS